MRRFHYTLLRLVSAFDRFVRQRLTGAGKLAGTDLTAEALPLLEKMFGGAVKSYRIGTARRGLGKKLEAAGYELTHYTYRKAAA